MRQVRRQQEQREHRGPRDIGLVHVALDEPGLVAHAGLGGELPRQDDEIGIEFDAQSAGAEPGRRDDGAPVARPQVHHEVCRRHFRQLHHPGEHGRRRRQPHDVLARLSGTRPVGLRRILRGRRPAEQERETARRQRFDRTARHGLEPEGVVTVPSITSPLTLPVYVMPPAMNEITSPCILPCVTCAVASLALMVPVTTW